MARETLTDLRRVFICYGKTLRAHHRTLLDIRNMLKIIQKESDISSVIMESLKETRDSLHQIQRLLSSMRSTKRFIDRALERTFRPMEGKVVIDPCNKRVTFAL